MTRKEALVFIAALSRGNPKDNLFATEADELMDEMNASAQLRELVVADVVGGQYQCAECFPDGCRGRRLCQVDNATWREKERYASDVWDQPVSRIDLVHEIAKAAGEEGS
jgi:hypothetical protein